MPKKAFKVCALPLCNKLTHNYVCDDHVEEYERRIKEHEIKKGKAQDKRRGTAASRGYDSKWRRARDGYIKSHPLCVHCKDSGVVTKADVVDHIVPHKGDKEKFWNRDNWQSLCYSCHSKKTAKEDGGYGR